MNILIYVLVLLTAMAITVTSRIPSSLSSARLRKAYEERMGEVERRQLKIRVDALYGRKEKKGNEKTKTGDKKLNARLSLRRAMLEPASEERKTLSSLLTTLFAEEKWYRAAVEERPYVLDELLASLEEYWKEENPKQLAQLASIKLRDDQLQEFLNRSLNNGLLDKEEKSPFLHLDGGKSPLSVYLARRDLLLAVFGDTDVVDAVIQERLRLYRTLPKKPQGIEDELWKQQLKAAKQEASGQLEALFSREVADPTWLSFAVSTSKPPMD